MSRKSGFTLVEVLIVIAIVAIIFGWVAPRLQHMNHQKEILEVKTDLRSLHAAVKSFFYERNQTYPRDLEELILVLPHIKRSRIIDPFNTDKQPYGYTVGGSNNKFYVIYSVGLNGNGSASIKANDRIREINGGSCIFVSNAGTDTKP